MLKNNFLRLLLLFFICSIGFNLLGNRSVYAQQNRPIKLGVVNFDEITRKSLMSRDIARQIDEKRRAFRDEIKKEEAALRKENDEVQKQRVILAPAVLEKKIGKLRQRSTALQRKVQMRNQEFIRIRTYGTREYEKERAKALMDVTLANGFTLVFRQREVLVRADYLDITQAVLKALNKRKKSFRIPDDLSKFKK